MSEFSQILASASHGDPLAADQLLPLVYDELRRLAGVKMVAERPGETLQATALVHEAFLRLVDGDPQKQFDGRSHFFAAAAKAMQHILVDRARRKQRVKHGGNLNRERLAEDAIVAPKLDDDVLELNAALERLQLEKPRMANLVKLRYYVGFSLSEAADALGVSRATADRDWAFARAWLYRQLREKPLESGDAGVELRR